MAKYCNLIAGKILAITPHWNIVLELRRISLTRDIFEIERRKFMTRILCISRIGRNYCHCMIRLFKKSHGYGCISSTSNYMCHPYR